MANYLRVNMQETIKTLLAQGWSARRVARELGVNRRTVVRLAGCGQAKRATVTAGSGVVHEGDADSKRATVTAGPGEDTDSPPAGSKRAAAATAGPPGSGSLCAGHRDFIQGRLKGGLSAQRIYQDMVVELGFAGSYESVKRYARLLEAGSELPFRRMETAPGQEVQVDYGTGAWVRDAEGRQRKTHLFRVVLGCSRKAYSEVSLAQDSESFIRALENAFRSFGGATATIVVDNLKAGVLKPCVYDPELNPKLRDFAGHYGACVLPARPATPRHKGKVEASVKYAQNNALKGREFKTVNEQNVYLRNWESTVADTRVHGTAKRQVAAMFEEERPFLKPLPPSLFPTFVEVKRSVHRDGHVEVAKSYYSVPAEYVRREVWVRHDARTVSVHNHKMEQIALHAKVEPGRFSTDRRHIPAAKISNPELGNAYLLQQADKIGGMTGAWARGMLKARGVPGTRVLNGLLQLAGKHTAASIDKACGKALEMNMFRLHELKLVVSDAYEAEQATFTFLDEHQLIRGMSDYGDFIQNSVSAEVWQDVRRP